MFLACASLAEAICCISAPAAESDATPDFRVVAESDTPIAAFSAEPEPEQEEARELEQTDQEDPLAQRQADRVDRPEEWEEEPSGAGLYGSARIRYRIQDDESFWGDGGSRIGVEGQWQVRPRTWLFARAEAGFKILDELDRILDPGGSADTESSLFKRLLYVGVETPNAMFVIGKNWSPYYRVASFTDRFEGTGGGASGTYNAGTDGGPTGTGRADRALQARLLVGESLQQWGVKPFNLGVQLQKDEPIPHTRDANYGIAVSLSGVLEWNNDYMLGIAYSHAKIDADDPNVRQAGIDGDAQALLLGTRWFGDRWYLGTTVSRLINHETTDQDIYFNGWGWEVYGQYQIKAPVWAVGGWNYLAPDEDNLQAGKYLVKYGVVGLRYSFDNFSKMLFANAKLDEGRKADGTNISNTYTIGIRWDLP
jgi:outer membrane protein N